MASIFTCSPLPMRLTRACTELVEDQCGDCYYFRRHDEACGYCCLFDRQGYLRTRDVLVRKALGEVAPFAPCHRFVRRESTPYDLDDARELAGVRAGSVPTERASTLPSKRFLQLLATQIIHRDLPTGMRDDLRELFSALLFLLDEQAIQRGKP